MRARIFSPETITAMVPLVARIADDLAGSYREAVALLEVDEAARDRALDSGQSYVSEVEALGGTVRCLEPVRADFIAEVDGEIGYVCYQHGDTEAAHFHPATVPCEHRRVLRRDLEAIA